MLPSLQFQKKNFGGGGLSALLVSDLPQAALSWLLENAARWKARAAALQDQTATTSNSGSISCLSIPSIAINVPVSELGQLPQAPW